MLPKALVILVFGAPALKIVSPTCTVAVALLAKLKMPFVEFPLKVQPTIVSVAAPGVEPPEPILKIPPPDPAELPLSVVAMTFADAKPREVPSLKMPPPDPAELPAIVQLLTT